VRSINEFVFGDLVSVERSVIAFRRLPDLPTDKMVISIQSGMLGIVLLHDNRLPWEDHALAFINGDVVWMKPDDLKLVLAYSEALG
jgi:hypothetical protein